MDSTSDNIKIVPVRRILKFWNRPLHDYVEAVVGFEYFVDGVQVYLTGKHEFPEDSWGRKIKWFFSGRRRVGRTTAK